MSDKNKYNKDLIDRGWKNMSSVLDKEMPVKKKKKRIFFFLLFLGIIACGTMVRFGLESADFTTAASEITEPDFLQKTEENPDNNTSVINRGPIVNDSEKEKKINEKNDNEIIGKTNSRKINNHKPTQSYDLNFSVRKLMNDSSMDHLFLDKEKAVTIEIKKGAIKVSDSKILNHQSESIPNMNHIGVYANKEVGVISGIKLNDEPESISDIINIGSPAKGGLEENVKIKTSDLKILNHQSELIPNMINEKKSMKEKIRKKNPIKILEPIAFSETDYFEGVEKKNLPFNKIRRWKFGLEAGFVFQNKNELGGKLAWIATKKMKPQWLFHTGLEYNVQLVDYTREEQESVTADIEVAGNGTDLTSEQMNIAILKSSAMDVNSHFIKIPLLFGYKSNQSFEWTGGIVGSIMIYSGIGRNSDFDFAAAQSFNSSGGPKKIVPVLDIQASIGMTYYPNKKWGINIRYDNGFLRRKIKFKRYTNTKAAVGLEKYNRNTRQLSLSAKMYF